MEFELNIVNVVVFCLSGLGFAQLFSSVLGLLNKPKPASTSLTSQSFKEISDDFSFFVKRLVIVQLTKRLVDSKETIDGSRVAFAELMRKEQPFHQGLVAQVQTSMSPEYKKRISQYMDINSEAFILWISNIIEVLSTNYFLKFERERIYIKEMNGEVSQTELDRQAFTSFTAFLQSEMGEIYSLNIQDTKVVRK